MSDIPRYLPLSQRPRHDESGVTGDWAQRLSVVLGQLAAFPRAELSSNDDVARLAWRLRANRRARLGAKLRRRAPKSMSDDQGAVFRSIAAETDRRRALGDLASAVIVTLDLANATHRPVELDPVTLGAVAVARALSAPLPIRAVLGGVTLAASDGDWSVGRGPELRADGAHIVRFLYGRTALPPALS